MNKAIEKSKHNKILYPLEVKIRNSQEYEGEIERSENIKELDSQTS